MQQAIYTSYPARWRSLRQPRRMCREAGRRGGPLPRVHRDEAQIRRARQSTRERHSLFRSRFQASDGCLRQGVCRQCERPPSCCFYATFMLAPLAASAASAFGWMPASGSVLKTAGLDQVLKRAEVLAALSPSALKPVLRYKALVSMLRAVASSGERLEKHVEGGRAIGRLGQQLL